MIPYSLILKIIITFAIFSSGVFYLKNWKDKAVDKAVTQLTAQIQAKEHEITIIEQKKIIDTQSKMIKELQKIEKSNYGFNTTISQTTDVLSQKEIKNQIIDEANQILSNFNTKTKCPE